MIFLLFIISLVTCQKDEILYDLVFFSQGENGWGITGIFTLQMTDCDAKSHQLLFNREFFISPNVTAKDFTKDPKTAVDHCVGDRILLEAIGTESVNFQYRHFITNVNYTYNGEAVVQWFEYYVNETLYCGRDIGGWPKTVMNETVSIPCPESSKNLQKRTCVMDTYDYGPTWGPIDNSECGPDNSLSGLYIGLIAGFSTLFVVLFVMFDVYMYRRYKSKKQEVELEDSLLTQN